MVIKAVGRVMLENMTGIVSAEQGERVNFATVLHAFGLDPARA